MEIFVSIIIIKLIINMIINNILILLFFILRLCFKTEKLFGAQFGELKKCI